MISLFMIVHFGLWKVKQDLDPKLLQQITQHVSGFASSIKGVEVAYAGPVKSFELPSEIAETYGISRDVSMLARGYNHVLYIIFKDESSRLDYDSAPPHLELAPMLIPSIEGGMEGVLTIDFQLPG